MVMRMAMNGNFRTGDTKTYGLLVGDSWSSLYVFIQSWDCEGCNRDTTG